MLKADLRKIYLNKRKALSTDEVVSFSAAIFKNFKHNFLLNSEMKVHIFLPISKFNEINTKPFIEELLRSNIRVFVPRVNGEEQETVEITEKTIFALSNWGVEEPFGEVSPISNFDYVLVPLVYCDKIGNRIGYGKGYYDRFFKKISQTKKVGLSIFTPNELVSNPYEDDVLLDYLVTSTEVLSFANS